MDKENSGQSTRSELGLQVVPRNENLEIIFTASDGEFSDLSTAEKHYMDEIKAETKELRKLQTLMTAAALVQAYQIVAGVRDENPGVILPIAAVAILMVYVRNKSMVPTREKIDISKIKLGLIQDHEETPYPNRLNK
jgi:hypothetical protein